MRVAMVGILLFAPMYGILSTLVVNGRMTFFSDSLGHSALTGVAIGSLLGFANPTVSRVLFGILFAVLLCFIKSRGKATTEANLSVLSSAAMALGVALLSLGGKFAGYSGYLTGDLLAITASDIMPLLAALTLTIIYSILRYNSVMLVSAHPALARSRGLSPFMIETEFACVLSVIVMISIRWIGILMLNAMLIIPAACSRNLSRGSVSYLVVSVVVALISGIVGLAVSFSVGVSSAAAIVLVLASIYIISIVFQK